MQIKKWKLFLIIVVCVLSASLAAIIFHIMNARMSAYPYDTALDYSYDFNRTDAQIVNLYLKNQKFTLPVLNGYPSKHKPAYSNTHNPPDSNTHNTRHETLPSIYSAFLKINVNTTFMGKFFQPEVKLSTNKLFISEYFETGSQGTRYINISSLISPDTGGVNATESKKPGIDIESKKYDIAVSSKQNGVEAGSKEETGSQKDGIEIVLNGKRISFKDQQIQLILFKNKDIATSKILIIAPHPDDAEIAAFGIYSSNKNSYIVTVTAGDAGTYQYDELYSNRKNHFLKKGKIRTWNSIAVPLLSGIPPEQVLNLGFFDGTLKTMFKSNPSSVKALYTGITNIDIFREQNISSLVNLLEGGSNWNGLVKNLELLIKKIEPDIIVAPYPALDKHPDHKFSSIALFEAIKKTGTRSGSLYLYTNHFVLNEYYPYGKAGGVISPPPFFSRDIIYFNSLYSHHLSADRQKDKILSLEAMNDLRPDTTWRFSEDSIKMAVASIRRDIMGQNVSYYRRAVRDNELFFVVDINDIYDRYILNQITGQDFMP
ncbi:MAG: PIG-L family deacetylase [Desulfamplus sp.]|nr:PIG-L family deacetylase [Desulfamplus sp.]